MTLKKFDQAAHIHITGRATEDEAEALIGNATFSARDLARNLGMEQAHVLDAFGGAAPGVQHPHIGEAIEHRVIGSRSMLIERENLDPQADHFVHMRLDLCQAVTIEFFASDLLAASNEVTELTLHPARIGQVLGTASRRLPRGKTLAGDIQDERGCAEAPLPDLSPLDVDIAEA